LGRGVDAFTASDRVGKAYLQFAKSEPAYYSAMLRQGIPAGGEPELRDRGSARSPYCEPRPERLAATILRESSAGPDDDTALWAMSHGIGIIVRYEVMPRGVVSQCRRGFVGGGGADLSKTAWPS